MAQMEQLGLFSEKESWTSSLITPREKISHLPHGKLLAKHFPLKHGR